MTLLRFLPEAALVLVVLAGLVLTWAELRQVLDVKRGCRCTCRRWLVWIALVTGLGWASWLAGDTPLFVAATLTALCGYTLLVIRTLHDLGGHDDDDHRGGRHIRVRLHRRPPVPA
jgi:hypothetical protein